VPVAQLKDNQFLLAGLHCRVDFRPSDAEKHRQLLRVEEGTFENGVFQFLQIWNGDETDWGLNFGAEPWSCACRRHVLGSATDCARNARLNV
jgi:Domain of unknown function (DUF5597)